MFIKIKLQETQQPPQNGTPRNIFYSPPPPCRPGGPGDPGGPGGPGDLGDLGDLGDPGDHGDHADPGDPGEMSRKLSGHSRKFPEIFLEVSGKIPDNVQQNS